MFEIGLRFIERALLDLHIGFRLMKRRDRLVEIGLRGILFREKRLCVPR